jgi:hypothetical protein
MLLFRSEGHVEKWCGDWKLARGETFTPEECWRLACGWFDTDRGEPQWRRRTVAEAQALFDALGFNSPFWRLS